jgi:hypothetical protein
MAGNKINTGLSALIKALEEKQEIKISEAAQSLELSEHETESLAKILEESRILEIHYTLRGHKILKRGIRPAQSRETHGPLHKKHHVSAETERMVNHMRQKISEKRNKQTKEAERQKRLKEIKEGLAEVKENMETIRDRFEAGLI